MVEAVIGAALLLDGKDLPRLHLVYGLTPIAVAFLAEQLKLLATQTLLTSATWRAAPTSRSSREEDQLAFVTAVLRRELGVMATSPSSSPSWPRGRRALFRCALALSNTSRTRCYKSET